MEIQIFDFSALQGLLSSSPTISHSFFLSFLSHFLFPFDSFPLHPVRSNSSIPTMVQSIQLVASSMLLLGSSLVSAASNNQVVVDPQFFPAPQTSVTSTAFNPDIQNAGGTTNSAGTFNVVSLSESGSYVFDTNLPVTTTFAPDS